MSSTSLNNLLQRLAERLLGIFFPATRYESKLLRCQCYRPKTIARWKQQTDFTWETTNKILEHLHVFDGPRIRQLIFDAVKSRPDIFITSFGQSAKSGEVIFYEFRQATKFTRELIEPWKIAGLPPESRIIFVDDLVGTGTQSLDFIQNRLNPMLSPSHRPCLFSVCGTTAGINNVKENSAFEVVCALELNDKDFNHLAPGNRTFTEIEKQKLKSLNNRFGKNAFEIGLLVTFYYSTPNNTMPFLWKEGYSFKNENAGKDSWFALLPRKY
jgi:hypothetical protein